jgi:predicted phage terminase large subunit-like protein
MRAANSPIDFEPIPPRFLRRVGTFAMQAIKQHCERVATSEQAVEPPGSLLEWNKRFLPDAFDLPSSEMHRWIYEQLERMKRERGVLVNVLGPRGNSKSGVSMAYVLRCAVEATEPLIWIISDTGEQAEGQLDTLREQLEDNRILAAAYPEACGKGPKWRRGRLDLRNGVSIQAYGTGQAIRGRKKGSKRPTLIVGDDLQNDNVMTSGKRREKEQRWWDDVPMKAGNPRTNVIVVGTSLHRDCISEVHHRRAGWTSRKFAAIQEWPHRMELWEQWAALYRSDAAKARAFYQATPAMDEGARVLWPEWESLYDLMCQRERDGHVSFAREKQSDPQTPETCYFPGEWFDDRPGEASIWFDNWPGNLKVKLLTLDPSMGKTDRSDYSAYVWGGLDHDGLIWVDASIKRRTLPAVVADGIQFWREWMPLWFGVETNQFQGALPDLFHLTCRQSGLTIDCKPINNQEHKEIRIRRLEPVLCGRRLRIRRSPGGAMLVDQLRQFPGGMHDDGPDALEMFYRLLLMLQRRKR